MTINLQFDETLQSKIHFCNIKKFIRNSNYQKNRLYFRNYILEFCSHFLILLAQNI